MQKAYIPIQLLLTKRAVYNKYIRGKYDVNVSFLEGIITNIFASSSSSARRIAWVHNDITQVFGKGFKSKIKAVLNKKVYSKYDKIIFVSEGNIQKFEQQYDIPTKKQVIYNYSDAEKVLQKASEDVDLTEIGSSKIPSLLTVARLAEQKGIDRLINVHSKLIKENILHNFFIVGDGYKRKELEEQIKRCNVIDTFKLLGSKENPYPYIKQCDYFCLFSHFEGYPMVVVEAKILGKHISITDNSSKEVLKNYEKSKIVENTERGIYEGIKDLVQNKDIYLKSHQQLDYNNSKILNEIQNILEDR